MARSYSSGEILRMLRTDGWRVVRVNGDHHVLKHPARPGTVIVAHPRKDIPIGTLRNIFRQAGWRWPPG